MRPRKRYKKPTAKPPEKIVPTVLFALRHETWVQIAITCRMDDLHDIAESIEKRLVGISKAETVEIRVPADCCIAISRAAANHNVAAGIGFVTAASAYVTDKDRTKPVPSSVMAEAVLNVKEDLETLNKRGS